MEAKAVELFKIDELPFSTHLRTLNFLQGVRILE